MRNKVLWWLIYVLGLGFCVVPPMVAVIDRYGFWQTEQRVSAAVILLLGLCAIPLWRQIRNGLRAFAENPSAWGVWTALTVIFWLFRAIADDMLVICYIALPSSVVGALLMGLAHKKLKKEE